jgi:hypothetical protein
MMKVNGKPVECLYPPCKQMAVNGGLCKAHMKVARSLTTGKDRKTTWAELVAAGRALPMTKPIGRIEAWFLSGEGVGVQPVKDKAPNMVHVSEAGNSVPLEPEVPDQTSSAPEPSVEPPESSGASASESSGSEEPGSGTASVTVPEVL